jgi:hypothetical protein
MIAEQDDSATPSVCRRHEPSRDNTLVHVTTTRISRFTGTEEAVMV